MKNIPTDLQLQNLFVQSMLEANPALKLGDAMDFCHTGIMFNGKAYKPAVIPSEKIYDVYLSEDDIKILQKSIPTPVVASARSLRFNLNDIGTTEFMQHLNFKLDQPSYLHVISVCLTGRRLLENKSVGDIVFVQQVSNVTFETIATPLVLTQEILDNNSTVLARFAISN